MAVAARPAAAAVRVDFGDGPTRAVLNPWRADLVTARHSTGASTVSTYQVLPGPLVGLMRAGRALLEEDPMVRKVVELFEARPVHLEVEGDAPRSSRP